MSLLVLQIEFRVLSNSNEIYSSTNDDDTSIEFHVLVIVMKFIPAQMMMILQLNFMSQVL